MASCEKCWGDAYLRMQSNPIIDQVEHYSNLIAERKDNPCTPEEQAGRNAGECPQCKRMTIHTIIHGCVICGYKAK